MHTTLKTLAAAALITLSLACDKKAGDDAPTPKPQEAQDTQEAPLAEQPTTPTKEEEPKAEATPKAKKAKFKKLSKDQIAQLDADKKSATQWLNDGRKAVQAKNYAEGITLYTKAMKIRPNDATLLAELGWAHYLKGDLDLARAFSNQALLVEKAPKKIAALLYNLGRISEDEKKLADANVYYQRSLALRPNDVVQKRFDNISTQANPTVQANAQEVCAQAMNVWECSPSSEDAPCECAVVKTITPSSELGPFKAAALLSIKGSAGVGGSIDGTQHLAIQTVSGGWQHYGTVANNYSPGVSYIHNTGEVESIAFQQLDGQEVLVVRFNETVSDGDYSENSVEIATDSKLLVCAKKDKGAQCVELVIGQEDRFEKMLDDEEMGPDTPTKRVWTASAAFTPAHKLKYTCDASQEGLPDKATALNGEHTIDELFALATTHEKAITPLN